MPTSSEPDGDHSWLRREVDSLFGDHDLSELDAQQPQDLVHPALTILGIALLMFGIAILAIA